ncbi:YfhO family protein, partial [bacterium]|nr:YfhO family protein [bacterium]
KIQNVKGYHAAKLKLYQTFLEQTKLDSRNLYGMAPFLDKYLNVSHQDGRAAVQTVSPDAIPESRLNSDYAILDMLNVKYLISNFDIPDPRFKLVQQGRPAVYENTGVLPRAYFVERMKIVKGEAFFDYLKSGDFDPAAEAIFDEPPPFVIKPSDQNRVEVTSYDIHEIKLQAEVIEPALMVLSEIYYPAGWRAYVNGTEAEIFRTNYMLRSIFLEPGQHEIRFVFEPKRFTLGVWITFGVLVILLGLLIYSWKFGQKEVVANAAAS